jgi:hypothetical protein
MLFSKINSLLIYCPHWTEEDKKNFENFREELSETHNVEYNYPNFYAMKK